MKTVTVRLAEAEHQRSRKGQPWRYTVTGIDGQEVVGKIKDVRIGAGGNLGFVDVAD